MCCNQTKIPGLCTSADDRRRIVIDFGARWRGLTAPNIGRRVCTISDIFDRSPVGGNTPTHCTGQAGILAQKKGAGFPAPLVVGRRAGLLGVWYGPNLAIPPGHVVRML